jgi:hypothetical protein
MNHWISLYGIQSRFLGKFYHLRRRHDRLSNQTPAKIGNEGLKTGDE